MLYGHYITLNITWRIERFYIMIMLTANITKEELSQLEPEEFPGEVKLIRTPEEAEEAINYLSGFSLLGFDTETKPAYKKGVSHRVALLQLATEECCFLFRLNLIGFPQALIELLSNPEIKKIGLSLRDDFMAIKKRIKLDPQGFEDLQVIVPEYGIKDIGLQKVYALLFQKKISKSQRLTNWEAETLTEAQIKYAALDAWACLMIYKELLLNNTPLRKIENEIK